VTKKIEAIIREEALDEVKEALHNIGIVEMNVFEVREHGRQGGIELSWRGTSYRMDLIPKLQLNIVLSDHNLDKNDRHHHRSRAHGQGRGRHHLRRPRRGRCPHPHRRTRARGHCVSGRHRYPARPVGPRRRGGRMEHALHSPQAAGASLVRI
jgi:nitrogen regulatory protein PII